MSVPQPPHPPLSIGSCATLACLWEATAAKPGNVYRGADFDDLTYADFVTSAAVIGPIVEQSAERGVGATVLSGVEATRMAVGTNTNLGILLLLAPLAAAGWDSTAQRKRESDLEKILSGLTIQDARHVYKAIGIANPGALGKVKLADVNDPSPPNLTLLAAMQLAADRDLIARQYTNDFAEVFWLANQLAEHAQAQPLGEAVVRAYLELLAKYPDSLIARKCGPKVAEEASIRAAKVIAAAPDREAYERAAADFDFWLRSDGHRRNPGTSADMIAAGLFVLLRQERLAWPLRFYG